MLASPRLAGETNEGCSIHPLGGCRYARRRSIPRHTANTAYRITGLQILGLRSGSVRQDCKNRNTVTVITVGVKMG